MIKTSVLAAVFVLAGASMARAGGQPGSVGLGAEAQLSGIEGVSLDYDAGKFHAGALLGFYDPAGADNTVFEIGAHFYYHVHSTAMSDFGIGGGIGLASVPVPGMGGAAATRNTDVYLEPGFQIRLFLASNVALSFTGGLVIGVVDASGDAITGQTVATAGDTAIGVTGGAGIHYYFF